VISIFQNTNNKNGAFPKESAEFKFNYLEALRRLR
jgi:hypothetical protein